MIKFSENKSKSDIAIVGHVGCGHTHSLNNQVQDDSVGLAVVVKLLQEITKISLIIEKIEIDKNKIIVTLDSGGVGYGTARRGITIQEKNIIKKLIGKDGIKTHTLVLEAFGRVYGQGVLETPVAVQTAVANALLDSFHKNFPNDFIKVVENNGENFGNIIGTVLDYNGLKIGIIATVNATKGGIGPNEDLEGNSPYYSKEEIIKKLGIEDVETIVVESMLTSKMSEGLDKDTFFVRGDKEDDNYILAIKLKNIIEQLGLLVEYSDLGMKRVKGRLEENTSLVGERIVELGERLKKAKTSEEKVRIVGELAIVVSQDCGGISFMSNNIHEELGGAGVTKKKGVILSLIMSEKYKDENPIPYLTDEILGNYVKIIKEYLKKEVITKI